MVWELPVTLLCSGTLSLSTLALGISATGAFPKLYSSFLVKRSHYSKQPWYTAAKIHILENVLYPTVGNTDWLFHWNEDPALQFTISKAIHPTGCRQFVHWPLCIHLNVVPSPLSMILNCRSESHTVFPSAPSSNLPTDLLEETYQQKGKWVRENNQILHLHFCSTRCIQNWNRLN